MTEGQFPTWLDIKEQQPAMKRLVALAPLSKFKVDDKEVVGIREDGSYDDEDEELKKLATSLNADGQLRMQNPPHTYLSEDKSHLTTIGGNRRITAALAMLRKKVFTKEPHILCFVYLTDDRAELLRLAARDNAFRKNYNEIEEYNQIIVLHRRGLSSEEIGVTVGMSARNVERYISINNYDLFEAMLKKRMPYSRLAMLAEKLKDQPITVKSGTIEFLKQWLEVEVPDRQRAKKEDAARRNKKVTAANLEIGKMLKAGEFEGWVRDIDLGEVPSGKPKVNKVNVEHDGAKLKIGPVNLDLTKITLHELGKVLETMEGDALPALRKAFYRKKAEDAAKDDEDPDELKEKIRKKYGMADDVDDEESEAADLDPDRGDEAESPGFDEDAE